MTLTGMAIIGLFAVMALLMTRWKLREKDAEMTAMATELGLPEGTVEQRKKLLEQSLVKAAPEVISEVGKLMASGDTSVHEWTLGDKPDEMNTPGTHSQIKVKVQVTRTKL